MAGRRTNQGLFAFLALALATGALAYATGTPWGRVVVVAHGVSGLGLVVLAPWKSVIASRGMRRPRPGRAASVALAVLVAVAITSGVAHSAGLRTLLGDLTSMQVHVGAALVAVPFALAHVVARPQPPRRADLSRRTLLRAATAVGGAALLYGATEGVLRAASLPGTDRRFTGSHEVGSFRPSAMPVTQWLNDSVPRIDERGWHLVLRTPEGERVMGYPELSGFTDRVRATLDCTGGWYAVQDWEGVWLDRLLPDVAGRSVVVRSVTGYARRFPARDIPRLLLGTRVGGRPLSPGHGFPARLVAPGRRGFWWVKWVEAIEVSDTPWWWQPPFPLT